ncbi:MAG: hypothetical protein LBF55_05335, partial [Prevotellaceae bacterium]|nr:hypothetical protein [Prevotellaceae bacterium]
PFIESLTHDSYIIQAERITDKRYSTQLDKLLSLFEQNHFLYEGSEVSKQYRVQSYDDDIQLITSVLHEMVADPKEREEIEKEAEAIRILNDLFLNKYREQKQINAKAIEEKDKVIEEKEKMIDEKEKVIEEQFKQIAELKHMLRSKK